MKPGSFDSETSREMVGDERARKIETKARADADAGSYDSLKGNSGGTYWSRCQSSFELVTYNAQFTKRVERNKRKLEQLK